MVDPSFNEACADKAAEAWGHSTYRYCLMQKDDHYQWRWQEPLPLFCGKNAAVSPCFRTIQDAMEWSLENMPRPDGKLSVNDGWYPI